MRITPVTQFNFNKKQYHNSGIMPNFRAKVDAEKLKKMIQGSSSIVSGITAGFAMKNYFNYDSSDDVNMSDEKLDNQQNVTTPIKETRKNIEAAQPNSQAEESEAQDLISSLAWFIEDFDNYDEETQIILADEMQRELYNFIAENHDTLKNNEFEKLKKYINILQKRVGKNIPILENYNDINEIIALLDSTQTRNYYGSSINFNDKIVNSIANIVPTEANKKQYARMIELLKNLTLIDYNIKDEFDISVIEKILNAENYELLDVVKDKDIKYLPELDVVYNNIQDNKFKKLVDTINFNVDELISIIRNEDKTRLPLLDKYLSSPMILNNINIREQLIYAHERCSNVFSTYLTDTYPYIFS